MHLTKEIVRKLQANSSRFLRVNEEGNWEEVSDAAARDKVSHALKYANRSRGQSESTEDEVAPLASEEPEASSNGLKLKPSPVISALAIATPDAACQNAESTIKRQENMEPPSRVSSLDDSLSGLGNKDRRNFQPTPVSPILTVLSEAEHFDQEQAVRPQEAVSGRTIPETRGLPQCCVLQHPEDVDPVVNNPMLRSQGGIAAECAHATDCGNHFNVTSQKNGGIEQWQIWLTHDQNAERLLHCKIALTGGSSTAPENADGLSAMYKSSMTPGCYSQGQFEFLLQQHQAKMHASKSPPGLPTTLDSNERRSIYSLLHRPDVSEAIKKTNHGASFASDLCCQSLGPAADPATTGASPQTPLIWEGLAMLSSAEPDYKQHLDIHSLPTCEESWDLDSRVTSDHDLSSIVSCTTTDATMNSPLCGEGHCDLDDLFDVSKV